jgi:adenylate kinase
MAFDRRSTALLLVAIGSVASFNSHSVALWRPSAIKPLSSFALLASSSKTTSVTVAGQLNEEQLDFTMGYLNKHHGDMLTTFADAYTALGEEAAKRNKFSGGSFKIIGAKIVDIDLEKLKLEVTIKDRSKSEPLIETTSVPLDADPIASKQRKFTPIPKIVELAETVNPVDALVRRLNRLAWMADFPEVTGKLIQLGIQIGGDGVGELKENMYLNQVPHNRYVRRYFYDMAAQAALDAVILCSEGKISNRMEMVAMFPEMNPSMDSYRIGTLLELARTIGIRLAEENLRVRICVQGSMGVGIFTGVPKQLNGVATLLQRMDWESEEGEQNEGMVGDYIRFGAIGKEHVVNSHTDADGNEIKQDDVFILLCPQSMVGVDTSIMGQLAEMVEAAGDRPVILINPDLADKISAQGQQSVRGRKERIDFADSFKTIFQFQNIYVSGTSYFPILGSILKKNPYEPWVAHQRRDRANSEGEVYVPVLSSEEKPAGEMIMRTFEH